MVAGAEGEKFREGFQKHSRTLYTYVPAILIDVDNNHRGTVRHYHYLGQKAEDVPIKALYTGDGHGEQHALHLPEVGHMQCPIYPDEDARDPNKRGEPPSWNRHHDWVDGTFVADIRQDDEAPLDSPLGEYLYQHKSGAIRKVTEDGRVIFESSNTDTVAINNGSIIARQVDGQLVRLNASESTMEHSAGHDLSLTESGITGTHAAGHTFSVQDDSVRINYQRSDGTLVTVEADGTGASISVPDEFNDYASNPRSEVGVADDGSATVDGRARIGDSDAYRVDKTTENTDSDDPRTYEEVNEPAERIFNPTDDAETAYSNPSIATAEGPLDMNLFPIRGFRFEPREEDPDPTITDPTQPGYIELTSEERQKGVLPALYTWANTTTGELKMTGLNGDPGAAVVITTFPT